MGAAPKTKAVKNVSAPKSSKPSPSHPPYIQMITEAITAMKDRTGSSLPAIAKHIEEEQKIKDLPANFRKLLFIQLKKFVASGKLVKVKNSFKLPPKTDKKPKKPTETATTAAAPAAAAKPKAKAVKKDVKSKSLKVVKSPMKKKAAPAVAKAKKPKSIKSPVKKTAAAAAASKKAVPAAKKAKK
ncbi:hypothetical protein vseg_017114 [Gypsophila vaccaria]